MKKAEYQQITAKQRARFNDIAGKIERGEPLTKGESSSAASMLRIAADKLIGGKPPRDRKLDPGTVAVRFFDLVKEGVSKNKAYERLAAEFDCSDTAIKAVIRGVSKQIDRLLDSLG